MVLKKYMKDFMLPFCLLLCIELLSGYIAPISAAINPLDRNAKTMHYQNIPPNKEGEYYYEFQTTNGITQKAAGNPFGVSGVLQYVSSEGVPITMTYTADAKGYHPVCEHVPKTPDYIIRALQYIETHRKATTKDELTNK